MLSVVNSTVVTPTVKSADFTFTNMAEAQAVSVKLPTFWTQQAEVWCLQATPMLSVDCSSCRISFDIDQFKIISNGRTECKIKEALNIKNINPTPNQNLFQHGSSFLISVFK